MRILILVGRVMDFAGEGRDECRDDSHDEDREFFYS
jgi:hypothetical protein